MCAYELIFLQILDLHDKHSLNNKFFIFLCIILEAYEQNHLLKSQNCKDKPNQTKVLIPSTAFYYIHLEINAYKLD